MTPCAAKSNACCADPHENGLPANIARLLRDLDYTTGDDVFDQRRIDARSPHERLQHLCVKIDGMNALERTAGSAPSERRPHDIDDDGSAH